MIRHAVPLPAGDRKCRPNFEPTVAGGLFAYHLGEGGVGGKFFHLREIHIHLAGGERRRQKEADPSRRNILGNALDGIRGGTIDDRTNPQSLADGLALPPALFGLRVKETANAAQQLGAQAP